MMFGKEVKRDMKGLQARDAIVKDANSQILWEGREL